ncbi:hypothetical protein GM415_00520 [Pseudodesulfovibrio cashew]|uniref:Uncharacterized protein n=1 Tax=Pseudodesulfovibrio cashew TaxID=2678688 RepID=A0A6I6JLS5_9BACT|nr:hypothetical protein [Pseudodesulfovibrio cashew]QGY38684.1 hypothetical protein GM415_00520 [Pseudodesulfovibrio cashew]
MRTETRKCTPHAPFPLALLLTFATILLATSPAGAIMPPEVYAKASQQSRIKAIATITAVRTLRIGKRATTKSVTFKPEFFLGAEGADPFTGICESVETAEQKANLMVGGDIYFYPHANRRVFVTVRDNGGVITSMTTMTPELERIIREEPERLLYGIGRVRIKPGSVDTITPRLRGKEPLPESERPSSIISLEELGAAKTERGYKEPNVAGRGEFPTAGELQGRLQLALGMDDLEEAKRLLDRGADPNRLPGGGLTPLMVTETEPMANLLLQYGADPMARDKDGGTLLHYAVSKRDAPALIRLYAAKGVNPEELGWDNATPLMTALAAAHERGPLQPSIPGAGQEEIDNAPDLDAVLAALAEAGADLNERGHSGATPLITVTIWNDGRLAKALLKAGADKTLRDNGGKTAKDLAYELGHRYIYQMLE